MNHQERFSIQEDQILDCLGGNCSFQRLIVGLLAKKPLDPKHAEKTTFRTDKGLYQFNSMPFV